MNRKNIKKICLPSIGILLTVCALLLCLTGCRSSFVGNRIKDADAYELDIQVMNGTDTHTLELKRGDTLKIQFETERGALDMKVTSPDGTALYQGDGTATEFSVEAPADGTYAIVVVGQKAKGCIRIHVERISETMESEAAQKPGRNEVTLTAEDLVGSWCLAENEKDNTVAIEAIPGAMESGSSMEIIGNGKISWHIGAEGGTGTCSLKDNILCAELTDNFDGESMKMEFTVEKTDGVFFLYTEYRGLLLCWTQEGGETGKGGGNAEKPDYPGPDVAELVNLRGDRATVYKLADGTYMDCIERRFTYNGTDAWIDENGVEWNMAAD